MTLFVVTGNTEVRGNIVHSFFLQECECLLNRIP
jgi:hypothetical protein